MKRLYQSLIYFLFLWCSCSTNSNKSQIDKNVLLGKSDLKVTRILIKNKGYYALKRQECLINDSIKINNIISECDKVIACNEDVRTNIQRGYIEAAFILESGENIKVNIIYTVYDGVAFRVRSQCFKNDNLEYLLVDCLREMF